MCIIVDNDVSSLVFRHPVAPDFVPILEWIMKKDGVLIYGGKLARELGGREATLRILAELLRSRKAVLYSDAQMQPSVAAILKTRLRSNDVHVLALAHASGARILCSNDSALQQDFKDKKILPNPRGKIYKRPRHKSLLVHVSSCRHHIGR